MNTQNDDTEFVQADWLDPFPEPHTIPSGWDFSGLFPAPQPDSDTDTDTAAEMEKH